MGTQRYNKKRKKSDKVSGVEFLPILIEGKEHEVFRKLIKKKKRKKITDYPPAI